MSQGKNWRSYVVHSAVLVQLYLDKGLCNPRGRVSIDGLMRDTDMSLPPSRLWYKLHHISVTASNVQIVDHIWHTETIAWGFNIWEYDLLVLYRSVMQELAARQSENSQDDAQGSLRQDETANTATVYSSIESALRKASPRFAKDVNFFGGDVEWRLKAVFQMSISCWRAYTQAQSRGFYDKTTGASTASGDNNWKTLLAQARSNDIAHGFVANIAGHKRNLEQDSRTDGGSPSSKRKKMMTDMPFRTTRKRTLEDDAEDNHDSLPPKRSKVTEDTDSGNKRPRDDHDHHLTEQEGRLAKRQNRGQLEALR